MLIIKLNIYIVYDTNYWVSFRFLKKLKKEN